MVSKKKMTISWSGGKDSAFALYKILLSGEFEVVNLHTVIDEKSRRVGLHGVREALIERQAEHLRLPLEKIYLRESDNHSAYAAVMTKYYLDCAEKGIQVVGFGDIFLEDLRDYRMELLKPSQLEATFPLWKIDTGILVRDFLDVGFRTMICAADAKFFSDRHLIEMDQKFLETLHPSVDLCGENGEFHTYVFDGPIFKKPISVTGGEVVKKTYSYQKKNQNDEIEKVESAFWFQDLLI
jgi:uncharacterized protein (TIGR00290 family)